MTMLSRRHIACGVIAAATLHAAAFAAPAAVRPDRLTLFGVDMADATVSQFQAAAKAAGAKSKGRKGTVETFNVSSLGIPAVTEMTATYVGDRVMAAQYDVDYQNEQLRKMLQTKYGTPVVTQSPFGHGEFTEQYISDGTYSWNFPAGMQVVFKKPFSGSTTLTYLNADLLKTVETNVKGRADREASDKAKEKTNVF
ncbi:hypothetical protein ACG04R_09340 [Roseateles sp. BYS78W]|uniref:ABC transporter substrate-binding protein n=1 Tax=Pelomonas candidula TaxID=3299025 RepID=A0ABW7HAC9_9BURK